MALKNGRPITNTNLILLGTVIPSGVIQAHGAITAPEGWLICDGAVVSRTTYSTLFSIIGTTYGAGDGSTTFKLPDLRGQFLRGADQGAGVDPSRTLGSNQTDAFQNFNLSNSGRAASGSTTSEYYGASVNVSWNANGVTSAVDAVITRTANHATPLVPVNARTASETRPKNVAIQWCIKV